MYDRQDADRVHRTKNRDPERGESMEKINESKERLMKLTKEELVEKIWNERIAFRDRYERMKADMEREAQASVAGVRKVADQVICQIVRSCGEQVDDEYQLSMPVPDCPDEKFWGCKIETVDDKTWKLHCKLFGIPVLGETDNKLSAKIAEKGQEESK